MRPQIFRNGLTQLASSFAVNNLDPAHIGQNAGIDKRIDFCDRFIHPQTAQIDF